MAKQSKQGKKKNQAKVRRLFKKVALLFLLLIILAYGGLVGVSFIPRLQINKISTVGSDSMLPVDIIKVAESVRPESWLPLVNTKHRWLYPDRRVEDAVRTYFDRAAEVEIEYKEGDVILKVTEHVPVLTVCADYKNGYSDNCWYGDESGLLFQKAPQFTQGVYLSFIDEQMSDLQLLPYNWMEKTRIDAYTELVDELKRLDTDLEVIDVSDNLLAHYRVSSLFGIRVPDGASILIKKYDDIHSLSQKHTEQMEMLQLLYSKHDGLRTRLSDESENFKYVDISAPGKVYYKFGEIESAEIKEEEGLGSGAAAPAGEQATDTAAAPGPTPEPVNLDHLSNEV